MAATKAPKFQRAGTTKYGLRIDVVEDGFRFAVISPDGTKVHATATLADLDVSDAMAFITEQRRAARKRR